MKKLLLREAAKHKLQNRRRKRWQKTVSILACLVVFCTVYALILPALTAEADTYCGKEEHTHTEDCYKDKLICGKEEGQGAHHHTDDCYREVEALVCPTPESDGHQHTEACYTEEQVLTCTNTDEGHVHSEFDSCYTTEKKLTCGMEEGQGAHHHTAECYETKKELICGQEENDGHRHTAECYEKELICGKEEHLHTLACYSNPNADVENGDVWQNTVSSVTLTGNWGADLAAIAQTQTGYTESTANYAVAEDGQTIHGYTRYGAWANDPYRDNWSAQFADFCLSYAGVPTSAVPQNSDCSAWNYTIPDGYTPKTGDLLLLDTDNNGSADHAGIVISADDSALTAIVGDADKAVRNNTYNIGSENIKGYVSIPENPALADDNNEEETTETTPAPEVTEEPQETPAPEVTPEAEPTQKPDNKADDSAEDNKIQDADAKEDTVKKDNIEEIPTPTPEVTETPTVTLQKIPNKRPNRVQAKATDDSQYITSVDAQKNGSELKPDENGKYNISQNDSLKFKINYTLPAGTLSQDKRTIKFNVPGNVTEVTGTLSGVVKDQNDVVVGSYSIHDGIVEINFYDEYVEKNQSNNYSIDGFVSFEARADKINSDDKGETTLIFKDNLSFNLNIEDKIIKTEDLTVQKEATSVNNQDDTITYKITVSSNNGTASRVTLIDVMSKVGITDVNSIQITGAGSDYTISSAENNKFTIDLPQMNENSSYTIIYTAKLTDDSNGKITTNNKVTVDSTNESGAKLHDEATVETEVNRKRISKDVINEEGKLYWTIIINENNLDISGWTLSDILNGYPYEKEVDISPSINEQSKIKLPYKFPEGTTKTYTITYEATEKDLGKNQALNKAILTSPDGKTSYDTGDVWGWIGNDSFNPLTKTGEGINSADDNETAITKWNVSISATEGSIQAPWIYTDELENNQWFKKGQIEALIQSLNEALSRANLHMIYTVEVKSSNGSYIAYTEMNDQTQYTGYRITFQTALEKGQNFNYDYEATASIKDINTKVTFANKGNINGKVYSQGQIPYEPSVPTIFKSDAERSDGQDSEHNYSDLKNNGEIKWNIVVNLPEKYEDGILKIKEKLPEGIDLTYLGIQIDNLLSQQDITQKQEHALSGLDGKSYTVIVNGDNADEKVLWITVPDDLANAAAGKTIRLSVNVKLLTDENWSYGKKGFRNEVELFNKNDQKIDGDGQTQTINKGDETKLVQKSVVQANDSNTLNYTLVINPDGKDLLKGADYLTLKDALSYESKSNMVRKLSLGDVKFYEYDKENKSKGKELGGCTYVYTEDNPPFTSKDTTVTCKNYLNMTIPDEKPILIEYTYKVVGTIGDAFHVNNSAVLEGVTGNQTSDGKQNWTYVRDSAAGALLKGINILKVDSEDAKIKLKGAKFKLYQWNDTNQIYEEYTYDGKNEFETNENGELHFVNVTYNTAYKLVETKAPDGYLCDSKPLYFYMANSDTVRYPKKIPTGFVGAAYAPGSVIYRPNSKAETEIEVDKKWFNKDGENITDKKSGSISFDLMQKSTIIHPDTEYVKLNVEFRRWTHELLPSVTKVLPVGTEVKLTFTFNKTSVDKLSVSLNGVTLSPSKTAEGTGTQNGNSISTLTYEYFFKLQEGTVNLLDFTFDENLVDNEIPQLSVDNTSDSVIADKVYGSYQISSDDGWKKLLTNLPQRGTENGKTVSYAYYVRETSTGNYITSYSDGQSGVTSGVLTIVNQNNTDDSYVLPETGGIGTNRFTAVGLALTAGSLMCGYVMRRKRREGRRN